MYIVLSVRDCVTELLQLMIRLRPTINIEHVSCVLKYVSIVEPLTFSLS